VDYSHTLELSEDETRRLLSRSRRLPKDLEEKFLRFGCEKWSMSVYKRNARLAVKAKSVVGSNLPPLQDDKGVTYDS
jgi:hypothetical protein